MISYERTFLTKNHSNFIKGVSVILVMMAHYAQWYIVEEKQVSIIIYLLSKMGRYGVALFFAISGYGLVVSAEKDISGQFLKRRFVNTYLPYILIQGTILFIETNHITIQDIVYLLLGIKAWFVCVIFIFYILFYYVWKFAKHKIFILSIGVLIISVLLAVMCKDDVWYASNIAFIIGVIIAERKKDFIRISYCKRNLFILGTAFFTSVFIYTIYADNNYYVYILFKIVASALWVVFFLRVYVWVRMPLNRFFERIGNASLECYLLHMLVLQIVSQYKEGDIFVLVSSVIATITISIVLNFLWREVKECLFRKH